MWGAGGKGSDDICEDFQKLVKYKTDPEPQKSAKMIVWELLCILPLVRFDYGFQLMIFIL